jgi:hypothetical protein
MILSEAVTGAHARFKIFMYLYIHCGFCVARHAAETFLLQIVSRLLCLGVGRRIFIWRRDMADLLPGLPEKFRHCLTQQCRV